MDAAVDLDKAFLTKNACIYSNERKKLSNSLLRSIDGVSDISSGAGFFRKPTHFTMRVGNDLLRLNATFDREKLKQHANGMHGWVDRIHKSSPILNLDVFHIYIDQINQMYGVVVETEFNFESPVWKTLLQIAEAIEGVIFVHDSFIDCDGRILFGSLV